jgi:hypothetical protein
MDKSEAKQLQRDFIPTGKRVDIHTLEFRRTHPDEIYQCCVQTGSDYPQSGAIYCGRVAEYIAFTPGGSVAMCGERGHIPPKIVSL